MWVKCTTFAECLKTDISAVLTVMSGLDPHSIRNTLGWLVNWDDVWLRVDSRVVLAWICKYGDGLYDFRWTPVSLHGLAVVHFTAWTCHITTIFWGLGMVLHLVIIGC